MAGVDSGKGVLRDDVLDELACFHVDNVIGNGSGHDAFLLKDSKSYNLVDVKRCGRFFEEELTRRDYGMGVIYSMEEARQQGYRSVLLIDIGENLWEMRG